MIIAIPTVDRKICMHFGHCEEFALVEASETNQSVLGIEYVTPPAHEPGLLPRWLHQKGVTVVIAGGMGQRAQAIFAENGIEVIVGATGGTPEELVDSFFKKALTSGTNPCDH